MMNTPPVSQGLAPCITKTASAQTFYTIRFLVDRERVGDAYRAYAYFRWVDDVLDGESASGPRLAAEDESARRAFVERQQALLAGAYRGACAPAACAQEQLLVELVRQDGEANSGLQTYLRNMMAVMAFDAERRGRSIAQSELNEYTHALASAVTEAMHYFIGHCCYSPHDETRYLAVTAAHITHDSAEKTMRQRR